MADAAPRITAFVRLPMFVSSAKGLLDDEAERMIEQMLADDPEAGVTIANAGGVRKMRAALPGRGKRGGARLIYFHRPSAGRIYRLLVYRKGVADDLSEDGKKVMRDLVKRLIAEK